MTSREVKDPGSTSGKPVAEQINELIASAWQPPVVADEAAVLRAAKEARR